MMFGFIMLLFSGFAIYACVLESYQKKDAKKIRNEFKKTYGLERIPKYIQIRVSSFGRLRNHASWLRGDSYVIEVPKWMYAKSDGSADLRIHQNPIIWGTCYFYLGKYQVISKRPDVMIQLVRELRDRGFEIPYCQQESEKWNRLYERHMQQFAWKQAEKIYKRFQLNPYGFEDFCTDLLNKMGCSAHTTKASNDGGYDIIGHKHTKETFVGECKCYEINARIGRPLIQKLVGANQIVGAGQMMFFTTCDFSKEAVEYAERVGVRLINGPMLAKKAMQYGMIGGKAKERFDAELTLRDLRALMSEDIFEKMIARK